MKTGPNDSALPREGVPGLTKREYFAGRIMERILAKYNLKTPEDQKTVAQLSVELADSLITELNK